MRLKPMQRLQPPLSELLLTILISLGLVWSTTLGAETITLRADLWPPYNSEPESSKPGYIIELATQIFAIHNIHVDYQLMGWQESLKAAAIGDINCVVGAMKADAPSFIFPNQSLGHAPIAFFAHKDHEPWQYKNMSSFSKKRIGVIKGYSYSEDIDAWIRINSNSSDVIISTGSDALWHNIQMLMNNRLDIIIESPVVFQNRIQAMKLQDKFIQLDQLPDAEAIYIACSPSQASSKRFIEILDEGLTHFRHSGRLQKILQRYGLEDWQDKTP